MPTTINGTTGVNLVQDGVVGLSTLASNSVNQAKVGTNTLAGTGPAFSAYRSGNQTLSSNTLTKVQYNAENFDTASCFDSSTNYRFTPTVAGYYQINYQVGVSTTACTIELRVVKNGDTNAGGGFWVTTNVVRGTGSNVIYFNGSTDYLEIYATISSGQTLDSANTYFSGFLARSA